MFTSQYEPSLYIQYIYIYIIYINKTLSDPVAIICTTRFNIHKFCVLPTQNSVPGNIAGTQFC